MRHADLIPSLTAWVRDDGPVSTWTSRAPGLIRAVVVVVVVAALPLLILTSCPANRDGMPGGLAAAMQETAAAVRSGALALQLWTQDRSTRQLVNVQLTDARDEVTKAYQGIAELRGFDIDVTPSGAAQQAAITEAVAEIAVNRACFEQVKGILMLVYRIDADVAFDLLKWRSQETNVKLRVLPRLEYDENPPPRSTFDRVFLTTHQRVRAKAASDRP